MQKVLTLFANPRGTSSLRLGEEDRTIRECFRRSTLRDTVELVVCHAATIDDVRRALLDDAFTIVHFSGHGTSTGLLFEDRNGEQYVPPLHALADLLAEYAPPLECAVFNACYSLTQGEFTSVGLPFTVAMESPIANPAAILFSQAFYDSIGAGKNPEFSFRQGVLALRLANHADHVVPVLLRRGEKWSSPPSATVLFKERPRTVDGHATVIGVAPDVSSSMEDNSDNGERPMQPSSDSRRQQAGLLIELAELIRHRVEAHKVATGMSMTAIAAEATMSKQKLSDLQNGKRLPSPEDLKIILRITRASEDDAEHARTLLHQIRRDQIVPEKLASTLASRSLLGHLRKSTVVVTLTGIVLVGAVTVAFLVFSSPEDTSDTPSAVTPPAPSAPSNLILGIPSASASSVGGTAHAEFYRDQGQFLLFDDRPDGKSAILIFKVNGEERKHVYNKDGMMTKINGEEIRNPPMPFPLSLRDQHGTIEFRVCVGDSGRPLPQQTCGPWTTVPAD